MEIGQIERELFVDASPEVVFDVVSRPEHVRQWWPDDASYEPTPGADGTITFGTDDDATVHGFSVVESVPPRTFSFRWTHPAGEPAAPGNSLLVTFELTPADGGTRLRMVETGFREMGWEAAVLEQHRRDHEVGWDHYLPRLVPHVASLAPRP